MKTLLLIAAIYGVYRYFKWRELLKDKARNNEVHHHHHYHVSGKDSKGAKGDYLDYEDVGKK